MTEDDCHSLVRAASEMVTPTAFQRMGRYCHSVFRSERRVTLWSEDYAWALTDPEWCEAIMLARLGAE